LPGLHEIICGVILMLVLAVVTAVIDAVVGEGLGVDGDVHADQHGLDFLCFAVVFGQEPEALLVHFLQVGLALGVIAEDFVQKSNGVESAHDGSEDDANLVIFVCFLKVFWVRAKVLSMKMR
jgi:hypothetical protein